MTLHSPSRGIMYSEPPRPTRSDETEEKSAAETETDDALEPIEASANWSGAVPADD